MSNQESYESSNLSPEYQSATCDIVKYFIQKILGLTTRDQVNDILSNEEAISYMSNFDLQEELIKRLSSEKAVNIELSLTNIHSVKLTFSINSDGIGKIMEGESEVCDIPSFEILCNEKKLQEYLGKHYSIEEIL